MIHTLSSTDLGVFSKLKLRLKSLSEIAVPTLVFPPQLGSTHNKTQGTEHIRQATDFHWSGEAILTHVI